MWPVQTRASWIVTVLAVGVLLVPGEGHAEPSSVVVEGRLVTSSGAPAAGRPVVLTRDRSLGDFGLDLLKFFSTLGIATISCVTGEPAIDACTDAGQVETSDAQGRFRFELSGEDVRNVDGRVRGLHVSAGLKPGKGQTAGPVVSWSVDPRRAHIELPEVPIWQPEIQVSKDGNDAVYAWKPMPKVDGASEVSTRLTLESRSGSLSAKKARSPARIDLAELEDAHPTAILDYSAEFGDVQVTAVAGRVRTHPGGAAPLSRGRGCQAVLGQAPARRLPRCWLHDGEFHAKAEVSLGQPDARLGRRPVPADCVPDSGDQLCVRAPVVSVSTDLGSVQPIGHIVLRSDGWPDLRQITVETSTDATSWDPVGTTRISGGVGESGDLTLPYRSVRVETARGTEARYVRIRADDPPGPQPQIQYLGREDLGRNPVARVDEFRGDLGVLTEISVWPPRADPPSETGSDDPAADEPRGNDDGGLARVMLVALLLVAGLLVAGLLVVVALLRRRSAVNGKQ